MNKQQIIIVKDKENEPVIQSNASNKLRLNNVQEKRPVKERRVIVKLRIFKQVVNKVAFKRVNLSFSINKEVKGS